MSVNHARAARLPMASVYLRHDAEPFSVAQTPREVRDIVLQGVNDESLFVEFTLMNAHPDSPWRGKPLFVDPREVRAIAPPYPAQDDD